MADAPAPAPPPKKRSRWIVIYLILLLAAYLGGFIPEWLKAREQAQAREKAEHALTVTRLEKDLAPRPSTRGAANTKLPTRTLLRSSLVRDLKSTKAKIRAHQRPAQESRAVTRFPRSVSDSDGSQRPGIRRTAVGFIRGSAEGSRRLEARDRCRRYLVTTGREVNALLPINRRPIAATWVVDVQSNVPRAPVSAGNR